MFVLRLLDPIEIIPLLFSRVGIDWYLRSDNPKLEIYRSFSQL